HVPLHTTLSNAQLAAQISHSQPSLILVSKSTKSQVTEALRQPGKRSAKTKIIVIDALDPTATHSSPEAARAGRRLAQQTVTAATDKTLATILYTSGTLGEPRGVMLSHTNLIANTRGILQAFGENPRERRLSFLPLSHIYARTCDLYVWLISGTEMVLSPTPASVLPVAQDTQPTFLNGVPFFYERIVAGLADALRDRGGHERPGVLKAALGGNIEQCSCGGAAVSATLVDYFQRQQVHLLPGYGLSEAAPVVATSTPQQSRRDTVGRPLPNLDIKISAEGEILVQGPNVMLGYYRDEPLTQEVCREGWLHTGDLGRIEPDGFLVITGRLKELIATKQGKKIPPVPLEQQLTADPLIAQVMIVGEQRDYLTALIVPDWKQVRAALGLAEPTAPARTSAGKKTAAATAVAGAAAAGANAEAGGSQLGALLVDLQVQQLMAARIAAAQQVAARREHVRRAVLLPERFSVENGGLTAKLTLRRAHLASQHADLIEAMYAGDRRERSWFEVPSTEK
ncbi:MAG: AMP-dependent synthetase/ligase, partial [Planctomycetota bacterium]